MSGLGVIAWIAIGSMVGWTASRLMVGSEDNALRGTSAWMIGAILGRLGIGVVDSVAPVPSQLNGPVAPLGARKTPTYAAARNALVDQLLRDAMAHDAERYTDVGRHFDTAERDMPRGAAPELARLRVALTFWDGWIDARNNGWQLDGGIDKAEWPSLARSVAADLEGDRDVTNALVVTRFDATAAYSPPAKRVRALAARLRAE